MYTLVITNQGTKESFETPFITLEGVEKAKKFAIRVLEQQLGHRLALIRGLGRALKDGEINIETYVIIEFLTKTREL